MSKTHDEYNEMAKKIFVLLDSEDFSGGEGQTLLSVLLIRACLSTIEKEKFLDKISCIWDVLESEKEYI
jgi:hypothetical protein